jgi:hypothetical protein
MDTLGFQLNAGILWEAIPYSFVVDWFVSVSKLLQRFRKKWIPVKLFIKDIGVSVKFEGDYISELQRYSAYGNSDWDERSSGSFKFYLRRPMPLDDRYFDFPICLDSAKYLTTRKVVLGSLLLEQRIPRYLPRI